MGKYPKTVNWLHLKQIVFFPKNEKQKSFNPIIPLTPNQGKGKKKHAPLRQKKESFINKRLQAG